MAPEPVDLERDGVPTEEDADATREQIMKRFEQIGTQIMNRTGDGGPLDDDPIAGVLGDPRQARARGAAPRPGVRDGARADRRRTGRRSSGSPTR